MHICMERSLVYRIIKLLLWHHPGKTRMMNNAVNPSENSIKNSLFENVEFSIYGFKKYTFV